MWCEKNGLKYKYCERYHDPKTGRLKKVSITLKKKSDKRAYALLMDKIAQKTKKLGDYTLRETADIYLAKSKKSLRSSTYVRNRFSINYIVDLLGGYNLIDKLTAGYIYDRFDTSGKSPGTCNEHIRRLKTFIRWAFRNDFISSTECIDKLENFKTVPHRKTIKDKFMDVDELQKMLTETTDDGNRLVMEFLALSGLRIGELIALTDADVTDVISVTKTFSPTTKELTAGKTIAAVRDVHIQPELADCIRRLRDYMNALKHYTRYEGNLFVISKNGGRFQYYAFNKWFKENTSRILGRTLTVHSLRHTHASLLIEQGYPIDAIARRLGHENSEITREIYLHLTAGIKKKDAEMIDKIHLLPLFCPSKSPDSSETPIK